MKKIYTERNTKIQNYFKKNGIEIILLGSSASPVIVNASSGESLNCEVANSNKGLVFKFNEENPSRYFIPFNKLDSDQDFNFNYWFSVSSKKKIYFFENKNQYFRRYDVKDNKYIPIFTANLHEAHFTFRLERALTFQRKMNLKGVNLNIIRQWKNHLKTS